MKLLFYTLLILFTIIGVMSASLMISYYSGHITIQVDSSQEETVGVIQRKGFPVWFLEDAPGHSIMSAWNFRRFFINSVVWLAFFTIALGALFWKIRTPRE